jgi:hypothetical protein
VSSIDDLFESARTSVVLVSEGDLDTQYRYPILNHPVVTSRIRFEDRLSRCSWCGFILIIYACEQQMAVYIIHEFQEEQFSVGRYISLLDTLRGENMMFNPA